jgi:hypothetical protein
MDAPVKKIKQIAAKYTHFHDAAQWQKTMLVLELMTSPSTKGVFTMDTDALIMNTAIALESIVEYAARQRRGELSIIVAGDTAVAGSAQVIFFNTRWTSDFLLDMNAMDPDSPDHKNILPIDDNGGLVAKLCGCDSHSSIETLKTCYSQCDKGSSDSDVSLQIRIASGDFISRLGIPDDIL